MGVCPSGRNLVLATLMGFCCIGALIVSDARAQGFWECTNGPHGGAVKVLAVTGEGNLFAAQGGNSIYRSTNKGESWQVFSTSLGSLADVITCITDGPPGYVFAGTYEVQIGPIMFWRGARILRSMDSGETWQTVFGGVQNHFSIGCIVANSSGQVFASAPGDLLRSDDHGTSWKTVNTGLTTRSSGTLALDVHGRLWFGMTDLGLYRSTSNGEHMAYMGFKDVYIYRLTIHPNGHFYMSTSLGLHRSKDEGASWTLLNPVLPNTRFAAFALNAHAHLFAIPYDGIHDFGVFRSTDEGATWLPVNDGLINLAAGPLAVHSDGDIFVGTEGAGVFRSVDNAESWTPASQGLGSPGTYALLEHPDGTIWAGTKGAGIFLYQKEQGRWLSRSNGLAYPHVSSLAANANGHLFAGTRRGEILRSTDSGATWQPIFTAPYNQAIISFAINAPGDILAGTDGHNEGGAILRSTNNGDSWAEAYRSEASYSEMRFIVMNAAGHLFAAGPSGDLIRSSDNGEHWTLANTGFPSKHVSALTINSRGHLFAQGKSYDGMYRSIDNGESWSLFNSFFEYMDVRVLVVNAQDEIFAGTRGNGIFYSQDDGRNWALLDPRLQHSSVEVLICDRQGYLWTDGICRSNQSTTAVEDRRHQMITSFRLEQNYPNPFNAATRIAYTLPSGQNNNRVLLEVVGPLGQVLRRLVDQGQVAGDHSVTWDGRDQRGRSMGSGIYFYRLRCGNYQDTRKMLLLE